MKIGVLADWLCIDANVETIGGHSWSFVELHIEEDCFCCGRVKLNFQGTGFLESSFQRSTVQWVP